LRQLDRHKKLLGIQISLARFVDNTHLVQLCGARLSGADKPCATQAMPRNRDYGCRERIAPQIRDQPRMRLILYSFAPIP
jgi:hypothetical protein